MPIRWQGRDAGIVPVLKSEIDRTFAPLPATYVVTSGGRTDAEQDALWRRGRDASGRVINAAQVVTDTRDSAHERGAAIDFAPLNADGSVNWDPNAAALQLAVRAIRANPKLRSGADFILASGAPDLGHAELRNWRNIVPLIPVIVADATATRGVSVGGGEVSAAGEDLSPDVAPPIDAGDETGWNDDSDSSHQNGWFEVDAGFVIAAAAVAAGAIVLIAALTAGPSSSGGRGRSRRLAYAPSARG